MASAVLFFCYIVAFSSSCLADDQDNLNLPDFTRTYGFDSRPDVRLMKKQPKNLTDKQRLKAFKKSLRSKLQGKRKSGTKYGVHSYTRAKGGKRYGIGVRKRISKTDKHGIILHDRGANYERQRKKTRYYLGIDSRTPTEKPADKESTYMFFGIKIHW